MSEITIFAEQYLGKVFYFCLKKTGNEQDAADLAGEIGLEVVQALSEGKKPEKFAPWLWGIARNRWARWAAKRYYGPSQLDLQEYEELLPSDMCVEEDMIRWEELGQIRRELAFIRADYREILVAHYFEEKSVSEISRQFCIPPGTVKTRLQSSRKLLKEGMNMARQFGTRSFQPGNIYFIASGGQPTGLPWTAVERKIPINILCEANNNPSTVEELSMELGIAMPYMEEEVKLLEDSELLRKLDNGRYLTSFFISPLECQNEVNELSCRFAEEHCEAIWSLAGKALEKGREYEILNGTISEMDARAFFAFYIEQQLEIETLPPGIFSKFKRRDGGSWGFIGKEPGAVWRLSPMFFNNNGNGSGEGASHIGWSGYQSERPDYGRRLYIRDVPDLDSLTTLKKIAEGGAASLSAGDRQILACLLEEGFCVKAEDGEIRVAALIFRNDSIEEIKEYFSALTEYRKMKEEMYHYTEEIKKVIARYSVPYLKEDFDYYVGMSMEIRSIVAMLWKERGFYTWGNAQFSALYF